MRKRPPSVVEEDGAGDGVRTRDVQFEKIDFDELSIDPVQASSRFGLGIRLHMSESAMRGTASDGCKPTSAAHFEA